MCLGAAGIACPKSAVVFFLREIDICVICRCTKDITRNGMSSG